MWIQAAGEREATIDTVVRALAARKTHPDAAES
jgi:hypothetical protein